MVNKARKLSTNFQNWKISQRYIRIEHNKEVVSWFRTSNTIARINLRNSILIYKKDSANQIIAKMQFFRNFIDYEKQNYIAYPEQYQLRIEASRPQLVIIFSPTERKRKNDQYATHLPHYSGGRKPNIQSYYKGNFWARAVLKDNSKIVINGRTKTEAVNVVKAFMREVNPKYRVPVTRINTGEYLGNPFEVLEMKPRRADYYSQGQLKPYPDWQHYF